MATKKIITRNFSDIKYTSKSEKLAERFSNMCRSVEDMISRQPIYTTWIAIQLGLNKDPLIFNSNSTDKRQNLIASLQIEKGQNSVCNSFNLVIKYDPFNYGEENPDVLEKLDDLIAKALTYDMRTETSLFKGYLQYGYSDSEDRGLISPKYEFMMTDIKSNVDWQSGVTTYTIDGVSTIGVNCEKEVSFPPIKKEDNKKLVQEVANILFKYYGDESYRPEYIDKSVKVESDSPRYRIEIDYKTLRESPDVEIDSTATISPWTYCVKLLEDKISEKDKANEKYKDLSKLNYSQKPRYILYMIDNADTPTVRLDYLSPLDDNSDNGVHINYDFSWGLKRQSLVLSWNPEVDLKLYLINKTQKLKNPFTSVANEFKSALDYEGAESDPRVKFIESQAKSYKSPEPEEVSEAYNASITLVGIPCDVPLTAKMTIKPKILQTISRTAGVYAVTGATDTINSNGLFTTEIKLFRCKGLEDKK